MMLVRRFIHSPLVRHFFEHCHSSDLDCNGSNRRSLLLIHLKMGAQRVCTAMSILPPIRWIKTHGRTENYFHRWPATGTSSQRSFFNRSFTCRGVQSPWRSLAFAQSAPRQCWRVACFKSNPRAPFSRDSLRIHSCHRSEEHTSELQSHSFISY